VSVYDENGVPVVYRGPDQRIGLAKPLKHDPDELLLGESVVIHCKQLAGTEEEGRSRSASAPRTSTKH
jgi:hypothetical protein